MKDFCTDFKKVVITEKATPNSFPHRHNEKKNAEAIRTTLLELCETVKRFTATKTMPNQ